ncbi:alpha/beta fold hydrolase [Amycolatopsis jejuensis]|uniref:alpha/beta fold hydrolase n=1 Tax=Amycolatopsis jejuensis TaxID=330084 RepID=UPI00068ACA49|nr:alpha/beta hydrolase [Amycolatopsis jejuensis]
MTSAELRYATGPAGPIAYRDVRPHCADTMVFVHGLNMASGVWDEMAARLPEFRCVSFDLRGHGASVRRGPYAVENYLEDLSAVLDAADVSVAQLVGVSVGGLIGCAFAERHPDRVRSVVALGSGFTAQHNDLEAGMARMREIGVREYFRVSLPSGSLPADAPDALGARLVELAVTGREDVAMVEELIREVFEKDLTHVLAGPVGRPVLVVNGEFDRTCPPEGGRALAAAAGGRWQAVPGAGHLLPLEQPEHCARLAAGLYRETHAGTRRVAR